MAATEKNQNPLEIIGVTQEENRSWWEHNPMSYEAWDSSSQIRYSPDDVKFYQEIDRRFFESAKHFAHPLQGQTPFSALIDFPRWRGKRVLEIGCGMGSHAELFARAGAKLTAIDITDKAIQRTSKRFELNGLEGTIVRMDASQLDFPDSSFDLVWSWGVIHHAEDTNAIAKQIHRVLAPGGAAQVMVYHRNSLRYYVYGGLREGLMHGKIFKMSLYEVNKTFTDGAIARHYTREEILIMFDKFSPATCKIFNGEQEAYLPFIGKTLRRFFPTPMKRIDSSCLRRFGWFLFFEGNKL